MSGGSGSGEREMSKAYFCTSGGVTSVVMTMEPEKRGEFILRYDSEND